MNALFIALVTSLVIALASPECLPRANCRLPNCRCWNDPERPGNFSNDGTPQIVALTFSYAMNEETLAAYLPLFKGLVNPNNCPPKGTFFAQDLDTEAASLKKLYKLGHEIALTSSNGKIPTNRREWVESLFQSSEKLYDAGVPRNKIRGARSPNLYMGGDAELMAEMQFGMDYEASCVTQTYNQGNQMIWPYTYDILDKYPRCEIGLTANRTYPGLWQFLMPTLSLNKRICSTLSSCSPYIKTTEDAFTLLFNSFQTHYYKGRAPLVLFIDPQWLTKPVQVAGLRQFLQVIARYQDTWMVTLSQTLEWVRYPVPMYPTVKFLPWECDKEVKLANQKYNRRR